MRRTTSQRARAQTPQIGGPNPIRDSPVRLGVHEAAAILQLSPKAIRALVRSGELSDVGLTNRCELDPQAVIGKAIELVRAGQLSHLAPVLGRHVAAGRIEVPRLRPAGEMPPSLLTLLGQMRATQPRPRGRARGMNA